MSDSKDSSAQDEQDLIKRPWTSFVRCEPDPLDPESDIYRNSRYQVHLRRFKAQDGGPDLIHLSFKRLDRGIFIPYRDKMRIKDELVGPECEGVELYPARSREVDTANQYHLWIIDDPTFRFPFGFAERCVSDISVAGIVQEPWLPDERPADCLSQEDVLKLMREKGLSL
jgi:hypothetical protein